MKENREDPVMLDQLLEEMAQETPEMPADFHARWTQQIRAEAEQNLAETEQNPAEDAQIRVNTEEKRADARKGFNRQLRYILSAAAVFVFLIGGTLLTRSQTGKTPAAGNAAPRDTAMGQTAGSAANDAGAPVYMMMAKQEKAAEQAGVTEAAEEADYAGEPAAPGAVTFAAEEDRMEEAAYAPQEDRMEEAAYAPEEAYAAEEEAPAAAESGTGNTAEAPGESRDAVSGAERNSGAEPDREEAAPETSGFLSFLQDFAVFTLKSLAVAVTGAALAFLTAVLITSLKKRKNEQKKGTAE